MDSDDWCDAYLLVGFPAAFIGLFITDNLTNSSFMLLIGSVLGVYAVRWHVSPWSNRTWYRFWFWLHSDDTMGCSVMLVGLAASVYLVITSSGATAYLTLFVLYVAVGLLRWWGNKCYEHQAFVSPVPLWAIVCLRWLVFGVIRVAILPLSLVASSVLFVTRDLVVCLWPMRTAVWLERALLTLWLVVIPVLLAGVGVSAAIVVLSQAVSPGWARIVGLVPALALVGRYYWLYVKQPPHYPQWLFFLAQQHQIAFTIRSSLVVRRLKLRLALGSLHNVRQE